MERWKKYGVDYLKYFPNLPTQVTDSQSQDMKDDDGNVMGKKLVPLSFMDMFDLDMITVYRDNKDLETASKRLYVMSRATLANNLSQAFCERVNGVAKDQLEISQPI